MEKEIEIWKPVVGYEGLYEVSNIGRVKSLSRTVCTKKSQYQKSERILIQRIGTVGYPILELCRLSKSKTISVHRLVAKSFLENKNNYPYINHKDGNKINNHVDNLEWCTPSQNNIHSYRVLNRKGNSKPVIKMDSNENEIETYNSITEAAKVFTKNGNGALIIKSIINGYFAYGFYWKYKDDSFTKTRQKFKVRPKRSLYKKN